MPVSHLVTTATGSRPVVVWRATGATEGQAALVLGRTPLTWLDHPYAARQPVALAEAGYVVLAVDAPNWGNSVDMASIDAVLAWAVAGHGAFADRVPIVAHNRGALAAMNWAARHPELTAALCLQSPIMDLAGHYDRNPSDRASMEAAYGGNSTTFAAALPEWDPSAIHRLFDRRDLIGKGPGRFVIFRSATDTQTPPLVTDLLGGAAGAQIGPGAQDPTENSPATVIATTVALAARWEPYKIAADRMARWSQFICDAPASQGYQGGDGCSSVVLPEGTELDDFPGAAEPITLWFFADSFAGSVDCDTGQYVAGLPLRNVIVVEDGNGQLLGQVYGPGAGADWAPLRPSGFPDPWWWPIDATLDSLGRPIVACWHVTSGGRYGHLLDTHLVRLDPSTLEVVTFTALGSASGTAFLEQFLDPDPDDPAAMVYVLFQHYMPTYDVYGPDGSRVHQKLGRVPLADLTTPSAWRYWNGSAYVAGMANAVPLRDTSGAPFADDATIARIPSGYIAATKRQDEPNFRVYTAPAPEGPWQLAGGLEDQGDTGQTRYGGAEVFSYHPKFHPQIALPNGELMLTYNSNLYDHAPGTPPETATSLTTFRPRHVPVSLNRLSRLRPARRIEGT